MNIRFSKIQKLLFKEYIRNGYLRMWDMGGNKFQPVFDIAELSLISSEVSEAIEVIRNFGNNSDEGYDFKKLGLECADIIIRTLNFMNRKGLSAEYYIMEKHKQNLKRGHLHGKRV